jgi:WD40 repeat protein
MVALVGPGPEVDGVLLAVLDTATWQKKSRWTRKPLRIRGGTGICAISNTHVLSSSWEVTDFEGLRVDVGSVDRAPHTECLCSAISPDGQFFAQVNLEDKLGRPRIWNIATGEFQMQEISHQYIQAYCLAFSPDGTHLAGGGYDGVIYVWRISAVEEAITFRGHTKLVTSVTFSRDGSYLLSGSKDGTIRMWDWKSKYDEPGEPVLKSLAFSPDGTAVISGSEISRATLWTVDLEGGGARVVEFGGEYSGRMGVAFSPDGCSVASTDGFQVLVSDTQNQTIDSPHSKCECVSSNSWGAIAISPDNCLVASMHRHKFEIWDSRKRKLTCVDMQSWTEWNDDDSHRWNQIDIRYATFSPNGGRIACARSSYINIYTTDDSPVLLCSFKTKQESRWLSFSDDGLRIMNETETFDIPHSISTTVPQRFTTPGLPGINILHIRKGWVIDRNGNRQCWVPEAYRGDDVYASHGNTIVLGGTRVMFLVLPD